jgi:hypothetical protein
MGRFPTSSGSTSTRARSDKAKERAFGDLTRDMRRVAGANPFEYTVNGDLEGHGRALSLVFSNTPSTGARMPVGR